MDKERFVIPLSNGYKLVSERNTGEFNKELYVGIETPDGLYVQDLVIVRPTYKFEDNNVIFDSDKFEILLFNDSEKEDFTDKFVIPLHKDEDDC